MSFRGDIGVIIIFWIIFWIFNSIGLNCLESVRYKEGGFVLNLVLNEGGTDGNFYGRVLRIIGVIKNIVFGFVNFSYKLFVSFWI